MAIATYEPNKVTLILSGYQVTGFDSISIQYDDKPFKVIKGIRGINTRVRSSDTSATLTFSVLQTSVTNDILSEIFRQDMLKGSGRIEVSLKDASGTTEVSSSTGYIDGLPPASFSSTATSRQWTIQLLSTDTFKIGGNNLSVLSLF